MLRVSVCVLAESQEIKDLLSEHGLVVQTVAEVLPIRVMSARILSQIYVRLGRHMSSPFLWMCARNRVCSVGVSTTWSISHLYWRLFVSVSQETARS